MITVVSASYGGYDSVAVPPEQDCDVEWVMVTDGLVDVPAPWKNVQESRPQLHPRMAAKIPKCLPHRYASTDIAIWLDASATVLRPDFVSMCVNALGNGDVAQWVHPQRYCILPEADVSATMTKYVAQPVQAQAQAYIMSGHPRGYGLWATGCMVRRRTELAGWAWLHEQLVWTYQDQLSWPKVVRGYGLDVRPLPGGLWDREWLSFRPHASDQ